MAVFSEPSNDEVTLTMVRGDAEDLEFTVNDGTPQATKVNLTKATDGTASRPAVVRFAVKTDPDDDNSLALVFKVSHDPEQVLVADQVASPGLFTVLIDKPDTEDADLALSRRWDVELTQQGPPRSGASGGTVAATSGSGILVGTGTAFLKAKRGDVITITSGPNSGKAAILESVGDDTHVTTSFTKWSTAGGASFEIRRGKSTTVMRGDFVIIAGVVAQ